MAVVLPGKGLNVVGPSVETDGLILYYDYSNTKTYTGVGTNSSNLAPYPTYTGSLYNTPTYNATYPQSLTFAAASSEYLNCTEAYLGAPFTAMVIAKAPSSTWSGTGGLFGGNTDLTTPNDNGFVISTANGTADVNFSIQNGVIGISTNTLTINDITKSHLYFISYDNVNSSLKYGYDNNITTYPGGYLATGRSVTPLKMNLFLSSFSAAVGFINTTIYSVLLYNRGLDSNEISRTYLAFKRKYNLPS